MFQIFAETVGKKIKATCSFEGICSLTIQLFPLLWMFHSINKIQKKTNNLDFESY